ncbi:LOW QUALITY PROTEIN: WD repeat-containing protein 38 [Rhynchonycteris naso]
MNSRTPGKLAVGRVKYFGRHRGEVSFSALSHGQTLLTAEDGCVYGWKTQSGHLLWRLGGHTGGVPWPGILENLPRRPPGVVPTTLTMTIFCPGPVKFCHFPDSRLFASNLWDVAEAKCLQILKGHQRSVETVSFSPDSKQLASGGWNKWVMFWEVQGQMLRHLAGHRDSVQSSDRNTSARAVPQQSHTMMPTPTVPCGLGRRVGGHRLAGPRDATIHILDLWAGTPKIFHQELEDQGNTSCLCFSGLLASGSWDKTIHIWKPPTRRMLAPFKGHLTWVKSIVFSPDVLQLAGAGYSQMGVLDVAHFAFTPDRKLLLVSGAADLAGHRAFCMIKSPKAFHNITIHGLDLQALPCPAQGTWRPVEGTVRAVPCHRPKVTITENPADPRGWHCHGPTPGLDNRSK